MKPAIIFDMNGVLIDDEDLHCQAFLRTASQENIDMGVQDYKQFFAGRTDRDGFRQFLSEHHPGAMRNLDSLMTKKAEAYKDLASAELRQYPGAAALVKELGSSGYNLALVTSSTAGEAATVLEFLELEAAFEIMVTADDVTEGKPSPEPFVKAATALCRNPKECIVIEDSPSGVAAAKAADMSVVAIASTHASAELSGANITVNSINEISADLLRQIATSASA